MSGLVVCYMYIHVYAYMSHCIFGVCDEVCGLGYMCVEESVVHVVCFEIYVSGCMLGCVCI